MVSLFPSSVFKKEKEEMLAVVQAQLMNTKCSPVPWWHTHALQRLLGLLWLAPGCPDPSQLSLTSWENACMSLAQATTDQIWPLRTKNEQIFSKLSERHSFPTNILALLILELLCSQWSPGVTCQVSSLGFRAFQNAHGFLRLPAEFSDVNSCVCYRTTG